MAHDRFIVAQSSAGGAGQGHEGGHATHASDIAGPEERLAFALSDGRVGVLAVKGRKVTASVLAKCNERREACSSRPSCTVYPALQEVRTSFKPACQVS